jgi:DNA-nicking Smr family endonuclease
VRKNAKPGISEDDSTLFREAVRGTIPIKIPVHVRPQAKPPPLPVQSLIDVHDALAESASGSISWSQSMETGEEMAFLRDGLGRDVLRKLRRGHWVVQNQLDLHGLNREQARLQLAEFLHSCLKRGQRCVRIVHGKGLRSPNREPVLKAKVGEWLARRDAVLAFCQAPSHEGGGGALLVLLRA